MTSWRKVLDNSVDLAGNRCFETMANTGGCDEGAWIFSGSFNPLHYGHLKIYWDVKQRRMPALSVFFETVILPYGKETRLDTLEGIIRQFDNLDLPVAVSRCQSFLSKAIIFKRIYGKFPNFIVGMDTFERIFSLKYYHDCSTTMANCLAKLITNSKFLVYPRHKDAKEKFVRIVDAYPVIGGIDTENRFEYVDGFDVENVSSTQLRNSSEL